MLEETFRQNPGLRLAIIDPIFRFVSIQDANDYLQVTNALEGLLTLTRQYGVHILTVHHRKKRDSEDVTDGALGSTAISGSVDTYIDLRKDANGLRTIRTDQRYGTNLEETQLVWNTDSRSLELGITSEEAEHEGAKRGQERITLQMLKYVNQQPGSTQAAIYDSVTGKTSTKRTVFRSIVDQGLLLQAGEGVAAH